MTDTVYKKPINYTDTLELRNIRIYLYKYACKWRNRIKKQQSDWGVEIQNHTTGRETDSDRMT
jgi:hypothetical protein